MLDRILESRITGALVVVYMLALLALPVVVLSAWLLSY